MPLWIISRSERGTATVVLGRYRAETAQAALAKWGQDFGYGLIESIPDTIMVENVNKRLTRRGVNGSRLWHGQRSERGHNDR
jgi:hypothetical protein